MEQTPCPNHKCRSSNCFYDELTKESFCKDCEGKFVNMEIEIDDDLLEEIEELLSKPPYEGWTLEQWIHKALIEIFEEYAEESTTEE